MWTKAIIIDGIIYLKRDFGFWISVFLIWIGGIMIGIALK